MARSKAQRIPKPLEKEIMQGCIAVMELAGWRVFRRNTATMYASYNGKTRCIRAGQPGMADLWAVLPDGRHAEIEIKRPGNRPGPFQLAWLRSMADIGGHRGSVAFWCDSVEGCQWIVENINAERNIHDSR